MHLFGYAISMPSSLDSDFSEANSIDIGNIKI
jgi:hypothetical protein